MRPTLNKINSEIRRLAGDTEVAGGQVFLDAYNLPGIQSAWGVLYSALVERDLSQAQRDAYFNLPAFTSYLSVNSMGIADMGQPVLLYERSVSATHTIQSINTGTNPDGVPYVDITLVAPHGLSTSSQDVVIFRAQGDPGIDELNGLWTAIPQGGSVLRLMGCPVTANYTAASARLSWSTDPFSRNPIPQRNSLPPVATPQQFLAAWSWAQGAFRFQPCSTVRQIRLEYLIFNTIPDTWPGTSPLPVDGALDFLSHYAAAALLHPVVGNSEVVQLCYQKATGSMDGNFGEPGGFLKALLQPAVKQSQMEEQIIIPRFRPKRNVGQLNPY